jgi:hypothetical protein
MATAPPQGELLPLYPQLSPQNFRFVEIASIKQFLEKEVDSNLALYKKYKKLLTTVVAFRYFFLFVSVIFNAAGIGALSKIFQQDLAIYFEYASLVTDLLTMILFFIESKIMKKIEKHDEVHTLSASFLSILMDHFSKALDDGNISQQELTMILSEQAKYLELRKAIRKQDFHQSDSQDLIKRFRDRIHKSI